MEPRRYGPFPYSPIIDRPPIVWPNGAKLAVWVVPNIEFFPLNEQISGEEPPLPNIFAWSRRDYGNRIGVFRLMDAMAKRGIRGTVALNSEVCLEHPRIIERANALGWELMGHCQSNARPIHKMKPEDERRVVAETFKTIEEVSGARPRGWLGSGGNESWRTLENLVENGARYVADWINDDQPYQMEIGNPPIVSVPYSADINDTSQITERTSPANISAA
jgi:peptidoglycan/xylan/chitin deacetylase (PgdA/CDA1 family)